MKAEGKIIRAVMSRSPRFRVMFRILFLIFLNITQILSRRFLDTTGTACKKIKMISELALEEYFSDNMSGFHFRPSYTLITELSTF